MFFVPVSYTHLFDVFCAAHRADLVRHVRAAAVGAVLNELRMLAIRAAVVGRKAVHPVSYTHLDVYKRQRMLRAQGHL